MSGGFGEAISVRECPSVGERMRSRRFGRRGIRLTCEDREARGCVASAEVWGASQERDENRGSRPLPLRLVAALTIWVQICLSGVPVFLVLYEPLKGSPLIRYLPYAVTFTPMLVLAVVARWVGYRSRDALLWLLPGYDVAWAFKISWRLANLPYRDWPEWDATEPPEMRWSRVVSRPPWRWWGRS